MLAILWLRISVRSRCSCIFCAFWTPVDEINPMPQCFCCQVSRPSYINLRDISRVLFPQRPYLAAVEPAVGIFAGCGGNSGMKPPHFWTRPRPRTLTLTPTGASRSTLFDERQLRRVACGVYGPIENSDCNFLKLPLWGGLNSLKLVCNRSPR